MKITIKVKASQIGLDAGPFELWGVPRNVPWHVNAESLYNFSRIATVTRTQLLAGVQMAVLEDHYIAYKILSIGTNKFLTAHVKPLSLTSCSVYTPGPDDSEANKLVSGLTPITPTMSILEEDGAKFVERQVLGIQKINDVIEIKLYNGNRDGSWWDNATGLSDNHHPPSGWTHVTINGVLIDRVKDEAREPRGYKSGEWIFFLNVPIPVNPQYLLAPYSHNIVTFHSGEPLVLDGPIVPPTDIYM